MAKPRPIARNASLRDEIAGANPVRFLVDAMLGRPAVVRDLAGRIIGEQDPLDYQQRVQIAQALTNKLLPSLQAQAIDLSNSDGTIQLILGGIVPPGGGQIIDGQAVEPDLVEAQDAQTVSTLGLDTQSGQASAMPDPSAQVSQAVLLTRDLGSSEPERVTPDEHPRIHHRRKRQET